MTLMPRFFPAASLQLCKAIFSGAAPLAISQVPVDQFNQCSALQASQQTLLNQALPLTCDQRQGPGSNRRALHVIGSEHLNVAPSSDVSTSRSLLQGLSPNLQCAPSGRKHAPLLPVKGLHYNQAPRHFTREAWSRTSETPPITERRPFQRRAHGTVWDDPYQWLADPSDPTVQKHLEHENAYAEAYLAKSAGVQRKLELEMKARLPPDETSPPERWGKWQYWCKEGPDNKDYPTFYRRRVGHPGTHAETSPDEVLLDLNELAEEFGYVHVGACEPSPDHRYLAYTLDATATESWTLFIKDLTTGKLLPRGTVQEVVSAKWAEDGQTILYTQANELQIPTKVFSRRVLGPRASETEEDRLVYEEAGGPEWFADVSKTKDGKYLTVNVNSRNSSEVYLLDAANPQTPLRLVRARAPGVEYFVEHHRGSLLILTNQGNPGGKYSLMCAPANDPGQPWEELLPADPRDVITDMDLFAGHCVMYTLRDGLPNITVYALTSPKVSPLSEPLGAGHRSTCARSLAAEEGARVPLPGYNLLGNGRPVFDTPVVCSIEPGANAAFDAETLRFTVSSPVTPDTVFDCDMSNHTLTRVKQIAVPGLDASAAIAASVSTAASKTAKPIHTAPFHTLNPYTCTRVTATSADGTAVPVTVTHHSDLLLDGRNPALLIGYGAYGVPQKTPWSSHTLSLLDRGWVVATAHVRGGGEFGKRWHEGGRKQNKVRSFEDFEACAELLVRDGFADGGRLAAHGSSAGGLLVGAVVNRRPELFKAVILKVPFLDVLNTMLDPSLPLTAQEYEEWGNPAADRAAFERVRSYSPYDNVRKGARYPAMLITASMPDTRVGYWEAAKWVSQLRATVPTSLRAPILLFTSFNDGHFGQGGRYQQIAFAAREQTFLLESVGSRDFRKRERSKSKVLELVKSVWRRTAK